MNLEFEENFQEINYTHASRYNATYAEREHVAELNRLDIELYQYAKDLFIQRVNRAYLDENLPVPQDIAVLLSQRVQTSG